MTAETTGSGSGEVGPGRGGRMSRQRKTAAVLRLLRGEDLETVSRTLGGATAATLSGWRDAFLAAGEAGGPGDPARPGPARPGPAQHRRGAGEELASGRLKAKLGEALIERDLLREKIVFLEAGRPLAPKRPGR